jgi:hypothetical protein
MNVKYTDNTNQANNTILINASVFLRSMADKMIEISTPNTPKNRGNLRQDILKQVVGLNGKVKWGKNYAVFQEEKQFSNYTTAGTGPHFALNSAKKLPGETQSIAKKVGLI